MKKEDNFYCRGSITNRVIEVPFIVLYTVVVSPRSLYELAIGPNMSGVPSVDMNHDDTPSILIYYIYYFAILVTSIPLVVTMNDATTGDLITPESTLIHFHTLLTCNFS